jgi:hypothetical protein
MRIAATTPILDKKEIALTDLEKTNRSQPATAPIYARPRTVVNTLTKTIANIILACGNSSDVRECANIRPRFS